MRREPFRIPETEDSQIPYQPGTCGYKLAKLLIRDASTGGRGLAAQEMANLGYAWKTVKVVLTKLRDHGLMVEWVKGENGGWYRLR